MPLGLNRFGLKKFCITMNHNTDKDFGTSINERITMVQARAVFDYFCRY